MPLTSFFRSFTPACLRPAMDEEAARGHRAAPPATAPMASDAWRYRPHEHGSAAAFALHPDFQAFREHIGALTGALSAVVEDSPSAVANLQTFLDHVTTVDATGHNSFFHQYAADIYDRGAEELERLVQLIRDPRVDRGQARAEIRDLSNSLAFCSVAVMEELPASLRRLSPPPSTLPAKWHDAQVKLVQQSATETLRLSDQQTTSRHAVNALLPVLYKDAGLSDRLPDDPFVRKDLPKSVVEEARRRLQEDLRPSSVALLIAEDYLMRLGAWVNGQDAAATHAPLLTLARMEEAVQALAAEFGSRPPTSAAFRVDPDTGHCVVATDATLVAVHFLRCWRRESASRRQDKTSRIPPVARPVEGPAFMTAGRLAWAETHGECRLLELDDLPALKPDDLPGSALLSVIRNSSPDDLWTALPAEWMRDTAAFDALLDRIDDTALRACFERWQSSPTPLSKDQQLLLRDALLDRGRGAALFEGATLAWQRLTLPDLQDLEGMRSMYRRHLTDEVTTGALRDHLRKSWNAALSDRLPALMRVSAPGSSAAAWRQPSARPAEEWLFAAAEALSADPPQVAIDDIANALRLGPSAQAPTGPDQYWPVAIQPLYRVIYLLGKAQVTLNAPYGAQTLRPEHARILLRDLLNLDDQGRSRLLQWVWPIRGINTASFFMFLEAAVQAMTERGCNWSELNALLQIEGEPRDPEAIRRLAFTRASILHHSYPDGPAEIGLLPNDFSVIPTERKAFRDVAIQHDDMAAQA